MMLVHLCLSVLLSLMSHIVFICTIISELINDDDVLRTKTVTNISSLFHLGWLGGVVVSVSDSRSRGPGFNSRPVHRQATTLGKLLTPMCFCQQAVQFGTG